jgi:two-component system chemotaxis response regulator CheB
VLFESAADAFGPALAGVILTGANHDGVDGLKAVAAAGGVTVVEDPCGAYAPTMPAAALRACPSAEVMALEAIVSWLLRLGAE